MHFAASNICGNIVESVNVLCDWSSSVQFAWFIVWFVDKRWNLKQETQSETWKNAVWVIGTTATGKVNGCRRMCCVSSSKDRSHISACAIYIFHINADPCHCDCSSSLLHTNANCYGENKQRSILQFNFSLPFSKSWRHRNKKPTLFAFSMFVHSLFSLEIIMHLRCILIVEYLSRQNGR